MGIKERIAKSFRGKLNVRWIARGGRQATIDDYMNRTLDEILDEHGGG